MRICCIKIEEIFSKSMENETLPSLENTGNENSKTVNFDFLAQKIGRNFRVHKGRMHSCCSDIQMAAVKISMNEVGSAHNLTPFLQASTFAHEMASKFNKLYNANVCFPAMHLAVMDSVSLFNSYASHLLKRCSRISSKEYVLYEPYIYGEFEYFVTTSGHVTDNCPSLVQELCHFCYHESTGNQILTSLQGIKSNTNRFHMASPKLPDPSVSPIQLQSNFFQTHCCTLRCENLLKPKSISDRVLYSDPPPPYVLLNESRSHPPPPYEKLQNPIQTRQLLDLEHPDYQASY